MKAEEQDTAEVDPASAVDGPPAASEPGTRRGLLRWIAPVLASLGGAAKVGTAQASATDDFSSPPVPTGRCIPRP